MQAAVIPRHGSSEQVEVVDVPRPELIPGGVRLRLHAAALNHLDLFVIGGIPGLNLSMPHVLGADGAGVVSGRATGASEIATVGVAASGRDSDSPADFTAAGGSERAEATRALVFFALL